MKNNTNKLSNDLDNMHDTKRKAKLLILQNLYNNQLNEQIMEAKLRMCPKEIKEIYKSKQLLEKENNAKLYNTFH